MQARRTSATLAFPAVNAVGNFIAVAIRAGQRDQVFTVSDTPRQHVSAGAAD